MFDLISVGNALIDNSYYIDDAHVMCKVNREMCELCLRYGDKIMVQKFDQLVGGNNANNSVGASRLGLRTALYCHVGDDANGHHIVAVLKKEKVDTRYVQLVKGVATENAAVIHFQGERTILVFHQPWEYNLPDLDKSRWVYFSSVSQSFTQTPLIKQLERYLERSGAKLAFAPGSHVLKHGVKKLPRLLSLTKIIFCNLEEAKKILEIKIEKNTPPKELLEGLAKLGPQMVVITDGAHGSYGFDGQNYFHLKIFPAKVLQKTGAGDAFATATLAGVIDGQDLALAMRWGAANSASVVEDIGPQSGLLTYTKLQEKLKENSKIISKEI